MKTIEQIKQEFKNATGKELPIYTFNGKLGVLMERKHEYCLATDFIPMDDVLNIENIDYDAVRWVDEGADGCEEGEEITDAAIVNPEYEQQLLVDNVWSPVWYAKSDEYVRQLLVTTTKYYNWTSERSRMIDSLYADMKKCSKELDYYDGTETNEEDKKDRDVWMDYLKERLASEKKEWEEICSRYKDPEGWAEYNRNSVRFSSVMKEALDRGEYCTLVCKVANEFKGK